MPVYLFTFHAYGSWMPDHPRGYTTRAQGVVSQDEEMARNYRRRAKHREVHFSDVQQTLIVEELRESCAVCTLRLHYVTAMPTHAHALTSWESERDVDWSYNQLKQRCGYVLAKHAGTRGRPYFSRGGGDDRRAVLNREHFEHLMTEYLPGHQRVHWCERRPAD